MIDFITLNNIIKDLLHIVRGAKVTQSEPISERQIEKWIHEYRALLLKRDLDKNKMPNPDYIQEINYLPLVEEDIAGGNLTSLAVPTGFHVFKSKFKLPKTIDLNFRPGLIYVGNVGGDEIQFVPQGRAKWQQWKKYSNNDTISFLKNGYLYVYSPRPTMEFITVRGIFEIPTEVMSFSNPYTNQTFLYKSISEIIPNPKDSLYSKIQPETDVYDFVTLNTTNNTATYISESTSLFNRPSVGQVFSLNFNDVKIKSVSPDPYTSGHITMIIEPDIPSLIDVPYPIPAHFVSTLKQMILQQELRIELAESEETKTTPSPKAKNSNSKNIKDSEVIGNRQDPNAAEPMKTGYLGKESEQE